MNRGFDTALGLLLFQVYGAVPGFALLRALGLLERGGRLAWLPALGPAVLAGLVVIGLTHIALLVCGVPVGAAATPLAALGWTLAALVIARVRPVAPLDRVPLTLGRRGRWLLRGWLAIVAVVFLVVLVSLKDLSVSFDNANIWSLRGLSLFHHGALVDEVFRNPQFTYVHLDYPLLVPALEAAFLHTIGGVDLRLWHAELWMLFGLAVWTMAWLLHGLGGRPVWLVPLTLAAVSPVIFVNTLLGDADTVLAALTACAVLAAGRWIIDGRTRWVLLSALWVIAAINTKNEGLGAAVALLLAALVVTLRARTPASWRGTALLFGLIIAGALPWQLWVGDNPFAQRGTPPPGTVLRNLDIYVFGHWDGLWLGVNQVARRLVEASAWGPIVPCFLVLATVMAVGRRHRAIGAFYLLAMLLSTLPIVYAYWFTSITDIAGFEERTGPRLVEGAALVATVGLGHLLTEAAGRVRPDPPPVGDQTTAASPAQS